jgi:hypothetical protein
MSFEERMHLKKLLASEEGGGRKGKGRIRQLVLRRHNIALYERERLGYQVPHEVIVQPNPLYL